MVEVVGVVVAAVVVVVVLLSSNSSSTTKDSLTNVIHDHSQGIHHP